MTTEQIKAIAAAFGVPINTVASWYFGSDTPTDLEFDPYADETMEQTHEVFKLISEANEDLPGQGDYAIKFILTGERGVPAGGRGYHRFTPRAVEVMASARAVVVNNRNAAVDSV